MNKYSELIFGIIVVFVQAIIVSIIISLSTGSTFGERCANHWEPGSPEHELCVYEMANGIRDFPSQPLTQQ